MRDTKYRTVNSEGKRSTKEYTAEDAIDHIGFGKFQIRAGAVTSLTWIADSMEVNILEILAPILKCEWLLSDLQIALYSSILFMSISIFAPIIGALSDRYGRRRILILVTLIGAYYGTLSAFAPVYVWLVILRFFIGTVVGANPVSAVYASEFLPITNRDTWMAAFTFVSCSIGSMVGAVLAYAFVNSLGWRVWVAASSAPLAFAATLVAFSRNTPRFSLVSGNWEEAIETLQLMAKWNNSTLPEGQLVKSIPVTISYYGTLMSAAQLIAKTGSSSITGDMDSHEKYSCSLSCARFSQSDFADLAPIAFAEFFGAVCGAILVEKLGRKWMMCFPVVLLALIQIVIGIVSSNR